MHSCAVVICAHTDERRTETARAVESVLAQVHPPDELVVVIDHNEGLLAWARDRFPEATVVPNTHPRGESGARNSGVAAVRSEVVVFLDDDATAAPDWLGHLLAWYQDPDVIGVGGAADPEWQAGRPAWFPEEFDWVVGCSYRGLPEEPATIRNLMGCNMSFRRQVIERAGGFYEGLGRTGGDAFGCSETEFCIRAQRELGGRFVFDPRARIAHQVPAQRGTWRYFARRCRAEGRSKAMVASRTSREDALASERRYVRTTLPKGVARGLRELGRAPGAAGRVGAIVLGVTVTGANYAFGLVTQREATP